MKNNIKIGITRGHLAGIGPEIIEKVINDTAITSLYSLEVFAADDDPTGVRSLEMACEALRNKTIDAVVTCPICKKAAAEAGFEHIGHTEYFSSKFGVQGREPLMFMVSDTLRVALVTKHTRLADVPAMISTQRIVDHLRSLKRSLEVDFGIRAPKIAVLGLNPHCGEEGLLGDEERNYITPAIDVANEENILAFGPFAADGFFGSGSYHHFDAVLAMYHDQGLAPFKALSFSEGVNFTAGLPVVRTSPAHGVGLDIAGRGIASADALRAAIYTAIDIVRNRYQYGEMTANPLPKSQLDNPRRGNNNAPQKEANVEDMLGSDNA